MGFLSFEMSNHDEIVYSEKISETEWWVEVGSISAICAIVPLVLLIWHCKRKFKNTNQLCENRTSQTEIEKFDPDKFTLQTSNVSQIQNLGQFQLLSYVQNI